MVASPRTFEDYPFEGKYLDLDGVPMHYLDEGEGPPVVMVHGNPTWSYYYRHLVMALRDRYRVIVPDHVGCGLSGRPNEAEYPYRLERRVADLDRLLAQVCPKGKITLVVHDWGGMIGMAWAVRNPERIARLVVLNTAGFHLPSATRVPLSLRLSRSGVGALFVRGLNLFVKGALRYCATVRTFSPGERYAYGAPYDSWKNRLAVHRFIQDIPLSPSDPGYGIVSEVQDGLSQFLETPTLLIWGMKDFVFDPAYLAEWERRVPHATVHRFDEAGHYVLEDAREEVITLVQALLDSPSDSNESSGQSADSEVPETGTT